MNCVVVTVLLTVLLHTVVPAIAAPLEVIKMKYLDGDDCHCISEIKRIKFIPDEYSMMVTYSSSSYNKLLKKPVKDEEITYHCAAGTNAYEFANNMFQREWESAISLTAETPDFTGSRPMWHRTDHIIYEDGNKKYATRILSRDSQVTMQRLELTGFDW